MSSSVAGEAAGLLDRSDERDVWHRFAVEWARSAYRGGYRAGHAAGYATGYGQGVTDWKVTMELIPGGPDHAELLRRRWGPGGREHFADPRPGDYPGREPWAPGPWPVPDRCPRCRREWPAANVQERTEETT